MGGGVIGGAGVWSDGRKGRGERGGGCGRNGGKGEEGGGGVP